jgi:hypothetical protein
MRRRSPGSPGPFYRSGKRPGQFLDEEDFRRNRRRNDEALCRSDSERSPGARIDRLGAIAPLGEVGYLFGIWGRVYNSECLLDGERNINSVPDV